MNWKINYWTLLFVLAVLAGFMYPKFFNDSGTPDVHQNCPVDITTHGQAAVDSFANFGFDGGNVKNGDIRYFKLPKCELREMLENKHPNSTVEAHLGLDTKAPDSALVSLYFRVVDADNRVVYYNFSTPCPPCVGRDVVPVK